MATELEWLRDLYNEDISTLVDRGGGRKTPRYRKPSQYERIPQMEQQDITQRKVFVWSDLHFGHRNIISFSDRPFESVEEMNEHLIANYNDYVSPDDVCIWVGDVSFYSSMKTNELLDRCNGYKILVVGNHDMDHGKVKKMNFDEVHLLYLMDFPEVSLVFTHFPMYNLPRPWINVHGHLHINFRLESDQHINVCCEYHNYRPLELETIRKWAATRAESFDL